MRIKNLKGLTRFGNLDKMFDTTYILNILI